MLKSQNIILQDEMKAGDNLFATNNEKWKLSKSFENEPLYLYLQKNENETNKSCTFSNDDKMQYAYF